ncbi:hypothetical protein [Streptomyces jumonjinensis]|uniref:hypothetical protein n=1 Tax=Streptomyces jumonjinensis TaxID=1945 RepID=UPI001E5BB5FB|nr:hypothetical protein [Streptomyces jumonjinensis]
MPETTVTEPLAPLTPDAVISAFNYLHVVKADDAEAASGFAAAEPRMPALLVDIATRIVIPVTALPGPDTDTACADTFALEALGRVFLNTLSTWERTGPDAAEGIARAVIGFAAEILTEDHETVADILHQLEAVGMGQALAAHSDPRARLTTVQPSQGRHSASGDRIAP